ARQGERMLRFEFSPRLCRDFAEKLEAQSLRSKCFNEAHLKQVPKAQLLGAPHWGIVALHHRAFVVRKPSVNTLLVVDAKQARCFSDRVEAAEQWIVPLLARFAHCESL